MKKYKHRRTGIIVEIGVSNKNYYYAYKENEAIIKWVVEDSLDWEEVKESNFLITAFKLVANECVIKHDTQLKDMYCEIDGKKPFYEKQDLLESHQTIVYSVKNSKGEEFTIGEKVMSSKDIFTISEFEVYASEVNVYFKETFKFDGLELISKCKTPIFISADNREYFEEDLLFGYSLFSVFPKANWQENRYRLTDCVKFPKEGWLHFHTKEARQEYIDKHKPKYSVADIEKAYGKVSSTFMITYANFIKELKKIREND